MSKVAKHNVWGGRRMVAIACGLILLGLVPAMWAQKDPGLRGGPAGAGTAIKGLSTAQQSAFNVGSPTFTQITSVKGTTPGTRLGLGPRYNTLQCSSCHTQPAIGGTSPSFNPEVAAATSGGAKNTVPSFVTTTGPALIARFVYQADGVTPDGQVHDLYVISGRGDAKGCTIAQPDFAGNLAKNNVVFRIPSPAFGAGLVEEIQNLAIVNNMNANLTQKQALGIAGHPNYTPDGGTISRFGWKAQIASMIEFAAEASNTEMGITNEMLPTERDETPGCIFNPTPEDHTNFNAVNGAAELSNTMNLAMFMRFLDQPTPGPSSGSTMNGAVQFAAVGCILCHTQSFTTPASSVTALSNITVNLYSDLLVHHMGPLLADGITQGNAGGDEFRTAPLWNVGQRIFFMHDGRTTDILAAIQDHYSVGNGFYQNSEANQVITNFNALSPQNQQDLLNFLRSL